MFSVILQALNEDFFGVFNLQQADPVKFMNYSNVLFQTFNTSLAYNPYDGVSAAHHPTANFMSCHAWHISEGHCFLHNHAWLIQSINVV